MLSFKKTKTDALSTKKAPLIPHDQQRRRACDQPPTKERIKKMYARPQAFTNLLPWLEYDPDAQCFLLDDGISVGALFDVEPISTEGRTDAFMLELRDKLQTVLTSLPEEQDSSPWIVQFYLQDEPNLTGMSETIAAYVKERAQGSTLTTHYLHTLDEHLRHISKPGGLFSDQAVTGSAWRGQDRKVRITLYRRIRTHQAKTQN